MLLNDFEIYQTPLMAFAVYASLSKLLATPMEVWISEFLDNFRSGGSDECAAQNLQIKTRLVSRWTNF